jgi:hypothetical protein
MLELSSRLWRLVSLLLSSCSHLSLTGFSCTTMVRLSRWELIHCVVGDTTGEEVILADFQQYVTRDWHLHVSGDLAVARSPCAQRGQESRQNLRRIHRREPIEENSPI